MKWEVWEVWSGDVWGGREDSVLVEADTPQDAAIEFRGSEEEIGDERYLLRLAVFRPGDGLTIVKVCREVVPRFFAEVELTDTLGVAEGPIAS